MVRDKYQSQGLFWLLILIGLLNVLDFFASWDLIVHGAHQEGNPLLAGVVDTFYFALLKLVMVPLALAFLWRVRHIVIPRYLRLVQFTCGVYTALMLYTWVTFYA